MLQEVSPIYCTALATEIKVMKMILKLINLPTSSSAESWLNVRMRTRASWVMPALRCRRSRELLLSDGRCAPVPCSRLTAAWNWRSRSRMKSSSVRIFTCALLSSPSRAEPLRSPIDMFRNFRRLSRRLLPASRIFRARGEKRRKRRKRKIPSVFSARVKNTASPQDYGRASPPIFLRIFARPQSRGVRQPCKRYALTYKSHDI